MLSNYLCSSILCRRGAYTVFICDYLYTCLGSYSVYASDPWVNDRYCVGVVLIPYLSAIVPNIPDRGVVRDSDSFIDSYIVPLSCIGLAEQYYYRGVIYMFLIYLANITTHGRSLVSQ